MSTECHGTTSQPSKRSVKPLGWASDENSPGGRDKPAGALVVSGVRRGSPHCPVMAKNQLTCPFCGNTKVVDEGEPFYRNHEEPKGGLCALSGMPIQDRQPGAGTGDGGPVKA